MVSSARFAFMIKDEILDRSRQKNELVYIIAAKDHVNWTLLKNRFFDLYGSSNSIFNCVESLNPSLDFSKSQRNIRIYNTEGNRASEIPQKTIDQTKILNGSQSVLFDFLNEFDHGKINSKSYVSTPNGQGVLKTEVNTQFGKIGALTIISGFSYEFQDIPIEDNSLLIFGLGMYYPSDYPISVSIAKKQNNSPPEVIFSDEIPPRNLGDLVDFISYKVNLSNNSGKNISLVFSANTKLNHDAKAHWALFLKPQIVDEKK
jgi:hypothetical protein